MRNAAKVVIVDCLGVKRGEEVLVIVDAENLLIGKKLFESAQSVGAESVLTRIREREAHGSEPPAMVAAAMKHADVVIAATAKSLSHTKARTEATKNGVRIASMPMITEEIMSRTMSADYTKIAERTLKLQEVLTKGKKALLTTPVGTNVTFFISRTEVLADTGSLRDKGAFGNLPAGETCMAPDEGKTNGVAFIDGSMAGIGFIKEPVKLVIKEGYVTEIIGGVEAEKLRGLVEGKGPNAMNIAELGIGTNEKANACGSPLEDEKVLGTVHIAIGDNISFGGYIEAPIHLDGIMKKPTLAVDGKIIINDGKHML